jgi:MarR family transcriptional regulator, organic hydroperoxide resistance regulator
MTRGSNKDSGNNLVDQFQKTSGLVTRYADRIFYKEMGISQAKYLVLSAIDSIPSLENQSRVAEKVQRNLNSLSMMVDRLVKSGLITRSRSSGDRRENNLSLTTEGKKKLVQGRKVNEILNKRLKSMLGVKDAQELLDTLITLEGKIIREIT